MLTMHPFVAVVRCVSVPEGTLPPLVPGVHAVDELPDLMPVEFIPLGGNELPEDEMNYIEIVEPPSTVLDDEGNIDPDKLYDSVDVENVIDVDGQDVDGLATNVDDYASAIKDSMLSVGASSILAYDNASAYVEALLQDEFNINAEVEHGIVEAAGSIMNLDLVCLFAAKAQHIPPKVLKIFLKRFAEESALKTHDAIQKKAVSARYSDMLAKAHARVKSNKNQGIEPLSEGPLGSDDSRSGLGAIRSRR